MTRQLRAAFVALACLTVATGMPASGDEEVVEVDGGFVVEGRAVIVEGGLLNVPADMLELDAADVDVQVGEAVMPQAAAPAPAGGFLGLGLRAMFNAIAPVPQPPQQALPLDEAEDGEMPKDPRAAQQWQQRKQIRQQAVHMEQLLQPLLRTELEMIRQACPDLPRDARREVLAAGKAAVTKTALDMATRQMLGGQPRRAFDAWRSIQAPIARALEPHASEDEFAAYAREQQARMERRAAAARVAILAKLDRRLELSATQRQAIEDDLARRWDDAWLRELDDNGMVINNERLAPDYANACIEPHLDEPQKEAWQRWRRAAGVGVVGMNVGWNLDGQGLHQEDDWWTR
ncbi:MAG: hypothetical protein ACKO40_13945 [Planctomycetaceae bacterium]